MKSLPFFWLAQFLVSYSSFLPEKNNHLEPKLIDASCREKYENKDDVICLQCYIYCNLDLDLFAGARVHDHIARTMESQVASFWLTQANWSMILWKQCPSLTTSRLGLFSKRWSCQLDWPSSICSMVTFDRRFASNLQGACWQKLN